MQVWNVLRAARWKYRTQKITKKSPSGHHRTTLSCYVFATKARIDSENNLLNSNVSPTCPHNMVNFGWDLLARLGTTANFNRFSILALLLHSTVVVGVSQTAALNRGLHLYSVGRPSRWALAHISSWFFCELQPVVGSFNCRKMTVMTAGVVDVAACY